MRKNYCILIFQNHEPLDIKFHPGKSEYGIQDYKNKYKSSSQDLGRSDMLSLKGFRPKRQTFSFWITETQEAASHIKEYPPGSAWYSSGLP